MQQASKVRNRVVDLASDTVGATVGATQDVANTIVNTTQNAVEFVLEEPVVSLTTVTWWVIVFLCLNKFLNDGLPSVEEELINKLPVQILLLFSVVYYWTRGSNKFTIALVSVLAFITIRIFISYKLNIPEEN